MLYGRSLSLCIRDILAGEVQIAEVGAIVSSTLITSNKQWIAVISTYADSYWRNYSMDDILQVVSYIRDNNLLVQPREVCPTLVQDIHADGVWTYSPPAVFSTLQIP